MWPSVKATGLLGALAKIGWTTKRVSGCHRVLSRPGWPDFIFAFHDGDEIGPRMLSRISKRTGLRPEDLEMGFKAAGNRMKLHAAVFV